MNAATSDPGEVRAQRLEFVASSLLSRAALLTRLLVKQVHNTELSRTEGEVLVILRDGPRRVTELAELEGLAQPTMTLLVKRLEASGWVRRERHQGDGRVALIAITESGHIVVEAFRARFLAAMRTDLEQLSDQQLDALSSATDALGAFVDVLQQDA